MLTSTIDMDLCDEVVGPVNAVEEDDNPRGIYLSGAVTCGNGSIEM